MELETASTRPFSIYIHRCGVNIATSVTFICLKSAYQKLQAIDGKFSKVGARKNRVKPHSLDAPPRREMYSSVFNNIALDMRW